MSSLLIGQQAPAFVSKAVLKGQILDDFSLQSLLGRYVVFFFYPLNFTFVCPTELHKFQDRLEDFHERGAEVVACSVDSPFSHSIWLQIPKKKGGIEGVSYTLVSDLNKTIATSYHVLNKKEGVAFRGLFLIDQMGIIRHQLINDLPIGRSIDEVLRTLDALIFFEKHGAVCPANWKVGEKALEPTTQGLESYFN